MDSGFITWKDVTQLAVWIIGAGSLAWTANSYRLSQKQLNFAVIVSCVERFQSIMPKLKSNKIPERQEAIRRYLDLCNEELFYFKNRYLPKEIVNEWLDGMIFYFPHFKDGENVNRDKDCLTELADKGILHDYPRIHEAFRVDREFDLLNHEERSELVRKVKSNLKIK